MYKVISVARMNNSGNGNPRYAVSLQDKETKEIIATRTPIDYGWVYGVSWHNLEGATIKATLKSDKRTDAKHLMRMEVLD